VIGQIRVGPEIIGVPGRKVNPMQMNEAQQRAEEKRKRKMEKRRC
jgi:hypothetical protein